MLKTCSAGYGRRASIEVGKKLTLFIYSLKEVAGTGKGKSKTQLKRLLYGTVELRSRDNKYRYQGVLSNISYWRPCPKLPVLIIEQTQADTVAKFFDKKGINYICFECSVKRIKSTNFWAKSSKHTMLFSSKFWSSKP